MNRIVVRLVVAAGLFGVAVAPVQAEDAKTLPTLLIKGEIVSVDTTDPATPLLKVKDRYGFETPIYLPQSAKISQGDQNLGATDLASGKTVEVEYNFDINTAKRQAVQVKVVTAASSAAPAASAPAQPDATPPAASAPEASQPAAPEAESPAGGSAAAPAPAAPEQPAATAQ